MRKSKEGSRLILSTISFKVVFLLMISLINELKTCFKKTCFTNQVFWELQNNNELSSWKIFVLMNLISIDFQNFLFTIKVTNSFIRNGMNFTGLSLKTTWQRKEEVRLKHCLQSQRVRLNWYLKRFCQNVLQSTNKKFWIKIQISMRFLSFSKN